MNRKSILQHFVVIFASITILSCSNHSKYVTESEFGDDWPFTVSNGRIECIGENYEIIFISDGTKFALNDAARETGKYRDLDELVKYDENYQGKQIKMDVSIIEFEALKLCDHRK